MALRHARSAAGVIAAIRIQRNPVATYRSVSGLVIAVFVVFVFAGASIIFESTEAPHAGPVCSSPLASTPPWAPDTPRQAEIVTVATSFLYCWTTQPLALAPVPAASLDGMASVVIVLGTDGTPRQWIAPGPS
jgi:hypothetical protein